MGEEEGEEGEPARIEGKGEKTTYPNRRGARTPSTPRRPGSVHNPKAGRRRRSTRGTPVNEGCRIRVRRRWGRGSAAAGARGRGGAAESSDRDSKARGAKPLGAGAGRGCGAGSTEWTEVARRAAARFFLFPFTLTETGEVIRRDQIQAWTRTRHVESPDS